MGEQINIFPCLPVVVKFIHMLCDVIGDVIGRISCMCQVVFSMNFDPQMTIFGKSARHWGGELALSQRTLIQAMAAAKACVLGQGDACM